MEILIFQNNTKIIYQQTLSFGITSQMALDIRLERNYLLIQNRGSSSILLKFDTEHEGSEGILIIASGNYESELAPRNAIFIKSVSGTNLVTIIEGTDGSV